MNLQQSPLGFVKKLLIVHWRYLLLLFMGVYLPLQVFEFLAVKIWQNQGGFPWDVPILLAIHSTETPQLNVVALILTKFGSFRIVGPILSAIALVLLLQKRWRSLAYLLTTGLGSVIINRTAKLFMHRVRPQIWHSSISELDYAFPSGHAMTSMTLILILLILTWQSPWRWLVLIFGNIFILGIAWTRLYLGVHFPSDILAGWMVALAWGIGVSLIIKPHFNSATTLDDEPVNETSLIAEETRN